MFIPPPLVESSPRQSAHGRPNQTDPKKAETPVFSGKDEACRAAQKTQAPRLGLELIPVRRYQAVTYSIREIEVT